MNIRTIASLTAFVSSFSVAAGALASTKKGSAVSNGTLKNSISGSVPKSGTLVAMGGSGSLGGSSDARGSYVGFNLLSYEYYGKKTTVDKTSVETPESSFATAPGQLEFYGHVGAWSLRPALSFGANASRVGVGYDVMPNLEVGGLLAYSRTWKKTGDKTETLSSTFAIGPQAFYYTEAAGYPLELNGALLLISSTGENKVDSTTTKTVDLSGYQLAAGARVMKELATGLEFYAGVEMDYSSTTDKSSKDAQEKVTEKSESGVTFSIVPAGVRFQF